MGRGVQIDWTGLTGVGLLTDRVLCASWPTECSLRLTSIKQ